MSVPTELHSTLRRTYHTLCISVRQPITEVKAEWNVAADVWEIDCGQGIFHFVFCRFRRAPVRSTGPMQMKSSMTSIRVI